MTNRTLSANPKPDHLSSETLLRSHITSLAPCHSLHQSKAPSLTTSQVNSSFNRHQMWTICTPLTGAQPPLTALPSSYSTCHSIVLQGISVTKHIYSSTPDSSWACSTIHTSSCSWQPSRSSFLQHIPASEPTIWTNWKIKTSYKQYIRSHIYMHTVQKQVNF